MVDLARAVTTQLNMSMETRVKFVESTMTAMLRNFERMNRPIFLVSNVGEDPQELLNYVYKIVHGIGMNSREKV